jgi:hypothetical protein
MKIKGTVKHHKLSGGFWGITDEKGNNWKPLEMPKELQKDGLIVRIDAEKAAETISIFMWGTSIKIIQFNIIDS